MPTNSSLSYKTHILSYTLDFLRGNVEFGSTVHNNTAVCNNSKAHVNTHFFLFFTIYLHAVYKKGGKIQVYVSVFTRHIQIIV
jgi:hypothetical protein